MITHVVLLKPKTDIADAEITATLNLLLVLQCTIREMVCMRVGKNLSSSHQGYTYGFVMQFADLEALRAYVVHPAHQVVSKEIKHISQSIIDFDLKF